MIFGHSSSFCTTFIGNGNEIQWPSASENDVVLIEILLLPNLSGSDDSERRGLLIPAAVYAALDAG